MTERLTERGFKVFVVPETPTLTMEGGGMIIMANLSAEKITKFQVKRYFYLDLNCDNVLLDIFNENANGFRRLLYRFSSFS